MATNPVNYIRLLSPLALIVIIAAIALMIPRDNIKDTIVLHENNQKTLHLMMPFTADNKKIPGSDSVFFTLRHVSWQTELFHITANQCLRDLQINGTQVDLVNYKLCDPAGINIDLSPYVRVGDNEIIAGIVEPKGVYGLRFYPVMPVIGNPLLYETLYMLAALYILALILSSAALRNDPKFALIGMVCLSLGLRLPYFFSSYEFIDEPTFINMGHHILKGNLPYTHLWDNKPPLLFYAFAALIKLGCYDIAGIRFYGSLILAATSWICYLVARKIHSPEAGWYSGALYLIASTRFQMGTALPSDHLAGLPMILAFYLCISERRTAFRACGIGLLVGIAAMLQTNYWFAILGLAGLLAVQARPNAWRGLRDGFLAGISSTVPFGFFMLMYWRHGEAETLWRSVVSAGFSFRHTALSINMVMPMFVNAMNNANECWIALLNGPFWPVFLLCAAGLLLIAKPNVVLTRHKIALAVFYISMHVAAGVRASRIVLWPHYFFGLVLQSCLVAGIVLAQILSRRNIPIIFIAVYMLNSVLQPSYSKYSWLFSKLAHAEPLRDDLYYRIASIINETPFAHRYIFAVNAENIVYFLTGSEFTSMIAHPHIMTWTNLQTIAYNRPIVTPEIFSEIRSHNPSYIITTPDYVFLNYLGKDFMSQYHLIYTSENEQLWQRNTAPPD